MRTVFLDRATFPADMELTPPEAARDWKTHDRSAPQEVVERLAGATAAITNKVPLRREAIEALPDLKFISVAATGYDVIDIDACRERGITVSNVRGYAVNTVPEHTFALILALRRSIVGYREDVLAGQWEKAGQFCFFTHPIRDLAGSRLGIIGEGAIGQAVAAIARGFGMEPVFAAHKGVSGLGPLYTPFEEVLETADIITLHCPLTPNTRDTLAMPEFRAMKRKPLIINTARGGLVNEEDVVRALEEGLIGGIGFDVLTAEPPEPGNPLYRAASRTDVILTPHVAWASREAMEEVWRQTIEAVDAFAAGAPVRTLT
jgi:glycerate dehydrogenase